MDKNLKFLLNSDYNILDAEIVSIETDKKSTTGISLTIGHSDKDIEKVFSQHQLGDPDPQFATFEIVLTKKELKKISKLLKEY